MQKSKISLFGFLSTEENLKSKLIIFNCKNSFNKKYWLPPEKWL